MNEIPRKYLIIGGSLVFLFIILGAVLMFGGGSGNKPSSEKIELTWWKTFEESDNVAELIEQYQAINKNITINFVKKDIEDYEAELVDAIASGRTPDIFSIHNDWLPKHGDKLSPMPESLMSLRTYRETFVDVATADFVKDNQIYALPMAVDVLALYYNKDILNASGVTTIPRTWPEVVAAVEKISRQSAPGDFSRSGIAMGTSSNINRSVDVLLLLMLQNGTQFYSEDLSAAQFNQTVNTQDGQFSPGVTALEFYTQFAQPSKKSYTWNTRSDFSIDAFVSGKLGMMLGYSYMRPIIMSRAPALNWDVASLPQVDTSGNKTSFANYWGESVSKFSAHQEAAWDFLNFISQKEALKLYYQKHELPSSRRDILTEQINDDEMSPFAENALTAKSVYKKDAAKFESIMLKMIDDVILRNMDAEDAVRSAAEQMNLLLRQ
jgi:ABC-type glycerol-3-phosphate transport system substrate-binding protein